MCTLPKSRKDVSVNCNQVDRRIEKWNKPAVLQLVPQTSLLTLERDRPRLPPLYLTGIERVNNLMYIPPFSVLDARITPVLPNHWMSQFVGIPTKEKYWGITYKGSKPHVRNYDVVNGLGYAERRSEHILAGYSEELKQLRDSANEIHRMSDLMLVSRGRRAIALQHALLRIHRREEVVRNIIANRTVRDINLHFAFNRAITRLTQFAATLERWSIAIRYNPNRIPNRSILQMLGWIEHEIPYFGSREIQPILIQVKLAIRMFRKTQKPKDLAANTALVLTDSLSGLLLLAVVELQRQADAVPEEEKEAAALIRSGRI